MQLGCIFISEILSLDLIGGVISVETGADLLGMVLVFAGRGIVVSFEDSMTIKT